ncbi:MAG: hypothetical protein RSG75_07265 [Cellulosilyticaceae bacterium]
MGSVQTLLLKLAMNIVYIVSDPIFIVLAILMIVMYRREAKETKDKVYRNQLERTAIKDIFRGVIIGAIMSLVLTSLGICIPITKGMLILIPITIGLVIINPKWGCFSYVIPIAYGVQVVGRLFQKDLTWLDLHYDEMIILIGILHIIEGLLVITYGHENSREVPLYREGRLVSGYVLKKYWPIPLMVFQYGGSVVSLIPMYAMLGYADITFGQNPRSKSRRMGMILVLYGSIITGLGYLTQRGMISILVVIMVMPILHEGMFLVNDRVGKA